MIDLITLLPAPILAYLAIEAYSAITERLFYA